MASIVSRMATRGTRRLAPRASMLWIPSAVLIGLVAAVTALFIGSRVQPEGNAAAVLGDRVGFQYVVHDLSPGASHWLEARSYLDGELALSNVYWLGGCATGSDALLGSDWSLWIGDDQDEQPPDPQLAGQPSGQLLVTSPQYAAGAGEPVQLTIDIAPDGRASWHRDVEPNASC